MSARIAALSFLVFASICLGWVDKACSALVALDSKTIIDSADDDFSQRVYSYDMDIDSSNNVHIVYSAPNGSKDNIVYLLRKNWVWQTPVTISSSGLRSSISTGILVGNDNTVHISYIRDGVTDDLYYVKIVNGVPSVELKVDDGAWHTVMQLDGSGYPCFIRENEDFGFVPAITKLAIVTTNNGVSWTNRYLNISLDTGKFRLAGFVYSNSKYHITYGGNSIVKSVLAGKGSSTYIDGVFHKFYYATSTDTYNWAVSLIDDTHTLYENEFWTCLIVDSGTPVVGMYKYAEWEGQYNTGTSAFVARLDGGIWNKTFTKDTYPNSREGASIAFVVDYPATSSTPSYYIGGWDFSPDDTRNAYFRGERGNIALVQSSYSQGWSREELSEKIQSDTFSAEGKLLLKKKDDKLHYLVLGDYVDTKLFYREYDFSYIYSEFDRIYKGFPWNIYLPAIIQ